MSAPLSFSDLHQALVTRYDLEELRTLCAQLEVDFDDLRGESRQAKARELILWLRRRGKLDELAAALRPRVPREGAAPAQPPPPQAQPVRPRQDAAAGIAQNLHTDTGGGAVVLGNVTVDGGSFAGRDSFTGAAQPGPQPAGAGTGERAEQLREREIESLHTQLNQARENLLLVRERKSQYVMDTDVPLDLIKRERALEHQIAELEIQLSGLENSTRGEMTG
jgi:hypothetical protein